MHEENIFQIYQLLFLKPVDLKSPMDNIFPWSDIFSIGTKTSSLGEQANANNKKLDIKIFEKNFINLLYKTLLPKYTIFLFIVN